VPEISRFYGIVIKMHRGDHPRPHFHAQYGDQRVSVTIADGTVHGDFPVQKLRLIRKWLAMHRDELYLNWCLMEDALPPRYIEPLE